MLLKKEISQLRDNDLNEETVRESLHQSEKLLKETQKNKMRELQQMNFSQNPGYFMPEQNFYGHFNQGYQAPIDFF